METTFAVDWANQSAPKNKAELQAAITQMFAEMDRINAHMDRRRIEIDRLAAETQARLANISRLMSS